MGLIDFILNAAGLLLWLNWRAAERVTTSPAPARSLLSTLRRVQTASAKRWWSLAALVGLLAVRAPVYWWIGPGTGWAPTLPLNVISLAFRSDRFDRMLLFSLLSFGLALAALYLWLLLLSLANRRVPNADVWQRTVRLQLGWLESWPLLVKLLLPLGVAMLLWLALAPMLARFGVIPPPASTRQVWQQGVVLGLASYLLWKGLIGIVLLLHVVNSHVYLGTNPFWKYVDVTARNLLAPLGRLPLRVGRMDFAPLVAVAFAFFIDQYGSRGLAALYQKLPL